MAADIHKLWLSPEEYVVQERGAAFRSEYWKGVTVAMAGGSPAHNRIVRNIARRLGNQLQYYVLLEQQTPSLDLYIRQEEDNWLLVPVSGPDASLTIVAAGVSLPFAEIYERVDFASGGSFDSNAL